MDVVIADRIQFAFTIMFHYLFPITTMGLVPFVALYHDKGGARRHRRPQKPPLFGRRSSR